MQVQQGLPVVLAGPLLRRCESRRVALWLALSCPMRARITLEFQGGQGSRVRLEPTGTGCRLLRAGERLYYLMLDLEMTHALPTGEWVGYQLELADLDGAGSANGPDWMDITQLTPDLLYPGQSSLGFVFAPQVRSLLHGSCRKPHHHGGDGLTRVDQLVGRLLEQGRFAASPDQDEDGLPAWPTVLIMTGDQIYADDVAGPMLRAIHQLIDRLGMPVERIDGIGAAGVEDSGTLYAHPASYYGRDRLLPDRPGRLDPVDLLFSGVRKPVFTSTTAGNHLVTLAELLAMYLLVWSPAPWQGLVIQTPATLSQDELLRFQREQRVLEDFVATLTAVRRVLAHVPVAMIFDDHDVTDDWNLSAEWQHVAEGHPFSRRVIGNALIAYALNQAWGNQPDAFDDRLFEALQAGLDHPGSAGHDQIITRLLAFHCWHYEWSTSPPLLVLDTRTRRWPAERPDRPAGLMDEYALRELAQRLDGLPAVLLVSSAPVFGVKLIEVVQRIFVRLGQALVVDAENWMGHPETAESILRIFEDARSPRNFVVLSGDVHYSFVYDVELKGTHDHPLVWQICSSGLRNTFPAGLLAALDFLNRWLYAPWSPLNLLTRRRRMRIVPRKPEGVASGRRLLNDNGIGLVELDEEGAPWRIRELLADGRTLTFVREEHASRWD